MPQGRFRGLRSRCASVKIPFEFPTTLTLGYCQFLELRRDDFQQSLETEPEVIEERRRVAEARLHNGQRGLGWKSPAPYN